MKRVVRKVTEADLDTSPITGKGEIVYSTIRKISDIDNPTIEYIETLTPDKADALEVLKFLDEQNGIGWTPELKRIEQELRAALFDLMSAKS